MAQAHPPAMERFATKCNVVIWCVTLLLFDVDSPAPPVRKHNPQMEMRLSCLSRFSHPDATFAIGHVARTKKDAVL